MAHQTFYRKYRSQNFKEIVGQTHIIQTLTNAITSDRLSHAYIFSGPRGTGKTSMARILAKSINCRNGKKIDPCGECDICVHITQGNSVDVVEIDAASHTGVDNIRDLNDKVNFSPVECTYKFYIIDEAHMLSTGAFNALLKTLEEPPQNTIFVLATTEPHKIPVTIHSRCQHLHFKNLTLDEITTHLTEIAQKEGFNLPEECTQLIARNSGGCMRDAVSLLDQAVSFKGGEVSLDDIQMILGMANEEQLLEILKLVFANQEKELLTALTKLFSEGVQPAQFLIDSTAIMQQILLIKLDLNDQIIGNNAYISKLSEVAQSLSLEKVKQCLEVMAKTEGELRWFSKPSLLVQIRLLSLMQQPAQTQVQPPQPVATQAPQPVQPIQPVTPVAPVKPVQPTPAKTEDVTALPDVEDIQRARQQQAPQPAAPAPVQAEAPKPAAVTSGSGSDGLQQVINQLKAEGSSLYGILKDATIIAQTESELHVKLKQDFKFFREKNYGGQSKKAIVDEKLTAVFGKPMSLGLGEGLNPQQATTTSAPQDSEGAAPASAPSKEQEESKRINEIVSIFEGTLV